MEFNYRKILSYIMMSTIVLVIIWFNVSYFKNRISSNHQSISEYSLSDEDVSPETEAAVAAVFYPADVYQKDKNNNGYVEHIFPKNKRVPRIMIEPHHGFRRSGAVAAESYKQLKVVSSSIKNVFLLGPAHKDFIGAALPKTKSVKTPLGDVFVNSEIVSELLKNPLFKKNQKFYQTKNLLNIQLPFLQRNLEDFKIIPILYGNIDAKKMAEILKPFMENKKSLLVISADMAKYLNSTNSKSEDEQNIDEHLSCGNAGIATAMILAQKFGLVPQLIDVQNAAYDSAELFAANGWSYEEISDGVVLRGIELWQQQLRNFVRHHREELLDIVSKSLQLGASEHYRVKRKYYSNFLFNRGASFVSIYRKGKLLGSSGDVAPVRAIAVDIADNIYKIMRSLKDYEIKDLSSLDISIQLLTDLEEIKFSSFEELLDIIEPNVDGLLIRSGEREGYLLPDAWLNFADKEDFIINLKIKAGLSPTYWYDDIKIFRFRAVEVK